MLKVTVDAEKFTKWASELSERGMRNAIRRAVDKSATAARKVAIEVIAQDAGLPKARIKPGVTKLRRTTMTDLSASFTATKLRVGILQTAGATVTKGTGLQASVFRLTGGGSASLDVRKAFIVHSNKGTFVAYRKTGSRLPLKSIYGEAPNTAMSQDDSAARVAWEKEARQQLSERLPAEIGRQLLAEGIPYSAPADTGD